MPRSGITRRELLAGLGLGIAMRPVAAAGTGLRPGSEEVDLAGAGRLAGRAVAVLRQRPRKFTRQGECAVCDLGAAGQVTVERVGEGGVQILLASTDGDLELLRALETPGVARVVARPAAGFEDLNGPAFDTLRRVPAGTELTFSSEMALRCAAPRVVAARIARIHEELAARVVSAAAPLLG